MLFFPVYFPRELIPHTPTFDIITSDIVANESNTKCESETMAKGVGRKDTDTASGVLHTVRARFE